MSRKSLEGSNNLSTTSSIHYHKEFTSARSGGSWWIVGLLLFSLIPEGLAVSVSGRTPKILLYDVVLIIVVCLGLLEFFVGEARFNAFDKTMGALALAYVGANAVSLFFNLLFSDSDVLRSLLAIKVFVFAYLGYVVSVASIRSQEDLRRTIYALVLWGGLIGLLLTYRFVTDWSSIIGPAASYEAKDEIGISMGKK